MGLMDFLSYICVCPSCFTRIYLAKCDIVSGRVSGVALKKAPRGIFTRMRTPERLVGSFYTQEQAHRQCYNCGYLLPYNIESVPSLPIVVVGDVSSGKSHYIASLIHQIKTNWMRHASGYARFVCLTPEVEADYTSKYFDPLFIGKQAIAPTQPSQPGIKANCNPLIYNLTVARSAKHLPTEVNLTIYDASGEDYERADNLVDVARFVLETRAFIFVVDPWTMAPVLGQLPAHLQTALQAQFQSAQRYRASAAERLNNTIAIVERHLGLPGGARFPDSPVAIMVTKADLFKHLNLGNYHFMANPGYGGSIDLQDIDTVDDEVRELLESYDQGDVLAAARRFSHVKFFATSATGEPPDQFGNFSDVKPCRCLDPILWILHELSAI